MYWSNLNSILPKSHCICYMPIIMLLRVCKPRRWQSQTQRKKGDWWYGILLIQCKGTNRLWASFLPFLLVLSKLHFQADVFTDLSFPRTAVVLLYWEKRKNVKQNISNIYNSNSFRLKTKGLPSSSHCHCTHILPYMSDTCSSVSNNFLLSNLWVGEWFYWNQDKVLGFYEKFPERRTIRSRRLPLTSLFLNYSFIHCCLKRSDVDLSLEGWENFRVSRHFVSLLWGVL